MILQEEDLHVDASESGKVKSSLPPNSEVPSLISGLVEYLGDLLPAKVHSTAFHPSRMCKMSTSIHGLL